MLSMPEPEYVTCFENIKEAWALLDTLDSQAPNTRVESIARIKALYAEAVPLQDKLKKTPCTPSGMTARPTT
jgi:hypothetical protein